MNLFQLAHLKNCTIKELAGRHLPIPLEEFASAWDLINQVNANHYPARDNKRWKLTTNGTFTVKLFYNFMNDGGLRCGWTLIILKGYCPKKINLFNWRAQDNKILLSADVISFTRSLVCSATLMLSRLITFLSCAMWLPIFGIFLANSWALEACLPRLRTCGAHGEKNIKKPLIFLWDLIARAITWNIWIERNARIFNSTCIPIVSIIVKIEHVILLWMSTAPDSKKARLEEPLAKVKRSLEFLSSADPTPSVPPESLRNTGVV